MRLVTAVLVLAGLLLAPATATAESVVETDGATTATLRWTPPAGDAIGDRDLRLTIVRAGTTVFDGDPGVRGCTGPDAGCAVQPFGSGPLTVRDLDGDAEPDVLVWLFTGGAHCCAVVRALHLDPGAGTFAGPTRNFRDATPTLRDLDADGRPELLGADARFAFAFASFAGSGLPLQVTALRGGVFTDVTRRFPGRIRADGRRWKRVYRAQLRGDAGEQHGALAAWVADRYLLGEGRAAQAFLRRELATGHLDRGATPRSGRAFVRALKRTLRQLGYR